MKNGRNSCEILTIAKSYLSPFKLSGYDVKVFPPPQEREALSFWFTAKMVGGGRLVAMIFFSILCLR